MAKNNKKKLQQNKRKKFKRDNQVRYLIAITQLSLTLTESHDAHMLLALVLLLLDRKLAEALFSVVSPVSGQRRSFINVEKEIMPGFPLPWLTQETCLVETWKWGSVHRV